MNKKLLLRKAHRYIGLFVSLQLLAWTIGGIWFTWNDIDDIHGDHLRNFKTNETSKPLISTDLAIQNIADFNSLDSIKVIHVLKQAVYRIKYKNNNQETSIRLINASTGQELAAITKQQAIEIAKSKANFTAEVSEIELITQTGKHHEYRGKPLPAWAVTFDYTSSPTFYISTQLGTFTSVRHTSWRIFDFLWMLHTMDYQGRDDFGNWLIKIFSLIALVTAISGIVLFIISARRRKKAR